MNIDILTIKKKLLDQHRPLPPALVQNLREWFTVELTYTSNALEGNTLTRAETAVVIEKGLTVGGKSLKEHLEATNHAAALNFIRSLVAQKTVTETDILSIHTLILKGIDDTHAGCYCNVAVRISGSTVVLPNPRKVPDLMAEFSAWLLNNKAQHPAAFAAEAHYRLVTIHPFIDGNGRTARLLMNVLLMMHGYPPAIIRKEDRLAYINALEKAQMGGSRTPYEHLIFKAIDRSLDIYLNAATGAAVTGEGEGDVNAPQETGLLKIGALAKTVGVPVATIRHWTKEGLLSIAETTPAGYQLYHAAMVQRCAEIQALQQQRLTLAEIRERLQDAYC